MISNWPQTEPALWEGEAVREEGAAHSEARASNTLGGGGGSRLQGTQRGPGLNLWLRNEGLVIHDLIWGLTP